MQEKACVNCVYSRGITSNGAVCLHPSCVDHGFTHRDDVTGEVRTWPDQPMKCYNARWGACSGGRLYQARAAPGPKTFEERISYAASGFILAVTTLLVAFAFYLLK